MDLPRSDGHTVIFSPFTLLFLTFLLCIGTNTSASEHWFQVICPNTPSSRMSVGIHGRVTFTDGTSTRLRAEPSTNSNIIFEMPEGLEFDVIGGPQCVGNFTWWQLTLTDGTVGWVSEGNAEEYFIEPISDIQSANSQTAFTGTWVLREGQESNAISNAFIKNLLIKDDGSVEAEIYNGTEANQTIRSPVVTYVLQNPNTIEIDFGGLLFGSYTAKLSTDTLSITDTNTNITFVYIHQEPQTSTTPPSPTVITQTTFSIGQYALIGALDLQISDEPISNSRIVSRIDKCTRVKIVDGPHTEVNPYFKVTWWRIQTDSGVEGWVIENFGTSYIGLLPDGTRCLPVVKQREPGSFSVSIQGDLNFTLDPSNSEVWFVCQTFPNYDQYHAVAFNLIFSDIQSIDLTKEVALNFNVKGDNTLLDETYRMLDDGNYLMGNGFPGVYGDATQINRKVENAYYKLSYFKFDPNGASISFSSVGKLYSGSFSFDALGRSTLWDGTTFTPIAEEQSLSIRVQGSFTNIVLSGYDETGGNFDPGDCHY